MPTTIALVRAAALEATVLARRNGLPRLARRLVSGEAPHVAWFGGSVTDASGLDEGDWGYRGRTVDGLRNRWGVPVRSTNAAIGGTGSDLGAFRLRQDVLSCEPDLVVVEFGVNDPPDEPRIGAAYEGIVRACLAAGADVLVVHTLQETYVEPLAAGRLPEPQATHEAVAEWYGVPSAHVGLPVAVDVASGALPWPEFAPDCVHPHPAGHERYAATLVQGIGSLAQAPAGARSPLADRRVADPWDDGQLVGLPDSSGWTRERRQAAGGWGCFSDVLVADAPGAEVSVAFHGPVLGLFHTVAADTGDVEVSVDGGAWRLVRLFDEYGPQFVRPHYRFVATDLSPGPHTARLRVADAPPSGSTGTRVELASLLVRGPQR